MGEDGWDRDSLCSLFQRSLASSGGFADVRCPRCSRIIDEICPEDNTPELAVTVEIGWCLELEEIKKRKSGRNANAGPYGAFGQGSQELKGIFCPCVRKYDFVCLFCWEALRNPNHNHGAILRTAAAAHEVEVLLDEEEEPLDWEDSMFLLSI